LKGLGSLNHRAFHDRYRHPFTRYAAHLPISGTHASNDDINFAARGAALAIFSEGGFHLAPSLLMKSMRLEYLIRRLPRVHPGLRRETL